jgi:hypothetical protein
MSLQNCGVESDSVFEKPTEEHLFNSRCYKSTSVRIGVAHGVLQVDPRRFKFHRMSVPAVATDIHVVGRFKVIAGGDRDIAVYVLDAKGFDSWQAGRKAFFHYESRRANTDIFNVKLPTGGTYYLMFDNSFSIRSPKSVEVDVELIYKTIQI